jgi:peptidoglycan-associated lipoprotein
MRNIKAVSLVFSCTLFLGACGSTVKLAEKAAEQVTQNLVTVPVPAAVSGVVRVEPSAQPCCMEPRSLDPLQDPRNILAKRSIYFDYDGYRVQDEFKALVEAHGQYLRGHKTATVVIQGNTDERGGREYNLALGQKRAEAVRTSLMLLGVPEAQIEAITFGSEKPKAEGSDEVSWAQNRRSDIVYQ